MAQFPQYKFLKKLNVIESEGNYIASISPIFFVHATQGKDSYEFQYLLKLYNKNKITPFEIDFPSNPQENQFVMKIIKSYRIYYYI